MAISNPYVTRLAGDTPFRFTFVSHSKQFQRATVSIGGNVVAVFNGSGEDTPMTQENGSPYYDGMNRQAVDASVFFECSADGSSYAPSDVAFGLVTVAAGDTSDHEYGETEMNLLFKDGLSG